MSLKFRIMALLLIVFTASIVYASAYKSVSSLEASKIISQKKNIFLLDVRTLQEYSQAKMKGSVLIPINEIERRVAEVPKNRPVLVFCAVGSRSNLVAGYLVNKGYKEVYNMTDGLIGWYRNRLPLEIGR